MQYIRTQWGKGKVWSTGKTSYDGYAKEMVRMGFDYPSCTNDTEISHPTLSLILTVVYNHILVLGIDSSPISLQLDVQWVKKKKGQWILVCVVILNSVLYNIITLCSVITTIKWVVSSDTMTNLKKYQWKFEKSWDRDMEITRFELWITS